MRTFMRLVLFCSLFLLLPYCIQAATVSSITITQVDTFALKEMPAQPVLKIKVSISGTGTVTLQKLLINFNNLNNSDVDSIAVYYTASNNRFSEADYPGEASLFSSRKAIVSDSVVYDNLSYLLDPGDHYFWVTMDLSSVSKASRTLDAYIKANGIKISDSYYPAVDANPSGRVTIYDIYFRENFEKTNLQGEPYGWEQECLTDPTVRWSCRNGGYGLGLANHPSAAKSGKLNAYLYRANNYKTIIVSKPIDLSLATRPILTFYHSQMAWTHGETYIDELRVLYKVGVKGAWVPLDSFELETNSWVKRQIYLPSGVTPSNLYLGFEGQTNYGWGECIDSICIYETKIIPRELNDIIIKNPVTDDVPQGSFNNAIGRVNIRIKGNTGDVALNSIKFTSCNTSDADIASNGVKLYYTNDSVFSKPVQIGTVQSFSGGTVTFTGLARTLETGDNYFWVTYDIASSSTPGNVADIKVNAGDISITGLTGTYPLSDLSPAGSRTIKQTIFYDDFESTSKWTLSGEFEIAAPNGLGGLINGNPDPTSAYSGTKVLGTDLTGIGPNRGDYESGLTNSSAYTAVSSLINARYYKNIQLDFYRYLNLDFSDSAAIEYQLDGSSIWEPIWTSNGGTMYSAKSWSKLEYTSLDFLNRKKFRIRFRLGPTDPIYVCSGWNIDDLFLSADSIPYDAAVSSYISPVSQCGLTTQEHVKVRVNNEGPNPLSNTPIKLSIDGGKTFITETITETIAVDGSLDYTFATPVDLSKPTTYSIIVKTAHPGDNYSNNDSVIQSVIAYPTYNLPYTSGFEQDTTFWFDSGVNSSWYHGMPSSTKISSAAEGIKCWKTDYSGYYNLYEHSYLTSPCFSFTGKVLPMINLKYSYITYPKDGAIMEYSTDQGLTWNYVPMDSYSYGWKWYNDTVTSLGKKGWTGETVDINNNQIWEQGRQILPPATENKNRVMFRFAFKADSTTGYRNEGFAFDDIKICEAPHDAGIETIIGLSDPACQYANSPYLNMNIKNYGIRVMVPGDSIIIGASVNGTVQAIDTLLLTSNLNTGATLNYTMKRPVDFSQTGHYVIKAFTMADQGKSIFGTNNDTASVSLTVYQNPVTGLPDSIYSARMDTLQIVAIDSAKYSYYWQDSVTTGNHIYSHVTGEGFYKLRVQNKISFCETKDSVFVKALICDVAIKQILSPTDNCGYEGDIAYPVIRIKNEGTDTLRKKAVIPIRIKLNSDAVLSENITLTNVLAPDSIFTDTLKTPIPLSAKNIYTLKVYSQMDYDINTVNDTATQVFELYGYPNIDLGPAQITVNDTSYRIIAASGYNTYLWNNDSTTRFNTVKKSGRYKIKVTDSHLCPASDSIDVFLKIRDIKPYKLVSPVSSCSITDSLSAITVRMLNAGTDTISTNDSIIFSYRFNGGISVLDTLKPTTVIVPGDSIDFTFTKKEDIRALGSYDFKIKVLSKLEADFYPANDSANYEVKVFGLPKPDMGILAETMLALDWTLDPGKGFTSYKWQDGSTDSVYIITKDHYMSDNRYQVEVSDSNGCSAISFWYTRRLIVTDVTVSAVNMVTAACSLSNKEQVKIKVKNVGNIPISDSKIILLKYQLDGGAYSVEDTLALSSTFVENQVIDHTFKQLADLSQIKNHLIKVKVVYDQDINLANDTLSHSILTYGSPTVNFGATNDTLVVDCPYTLDAGSGYISYLWSTNESGQSISANPGKYTVTVVDSYGCFGSQSVTLVEKLFDLGISGFSTPLNNCTLTNNETIAVEVQNTGSMPLVNQAFNLSYNLNGTIDKTQDFIFTGSSGSKKLFTFSGTENLSAINIHSFNVTLTYTNDELSSNNNKLYNVTVSGNPVVDLGGINDTIRSNKFPYILDAGSGFTSYKWQDNSTNQTFSAPEQGLYSVTVINSGGCSASKSVYIKNTLSVIDIKEKSKLKIYPNPATDNIWVEMDLKFIDDALLDLVTPEGKIIQSRLLKGNKQNMEQLEVGNLPGGMYYIRIYNKDWLVMEKILIQ
jgi:hypothetical protein